MAIRAGLWAGTSRPGPGDVNTPGGRLWNHLKPFGAMGGVMKPFGAMKPFGTGPIWLGTLFVRSRIKRNVYKHGVYCIMGYFMWEFIVILDLLRFLEIYYVFMWFQFILNQL